MGYAIAAADLLERYRTLREYTTHEQVIAVIEQLIGEICDRLVKSPQFRST